MGGWGGGVYGGDGGRGNKKPFLLTALIAQDLSNKIRTISMYPFCAAI